MGDIIIGRTEEGLIKIKKDDPIGLRAVNCACCSTCCPLPNEIKGKKFAVTSVSWSSIISFSTMDVCGHFSAQTADGYSINFSRANINPPPGCEWWDELWIGTVYNGGPIGEGNTCNLFSSFIFAVNPSGTHLVIDDYACGSPQAYPDYDPDTHTSAMYDACIINSATCYDWTLTISEVP